MKTTTDIENLTLSHLFDCFGSVIEAIAYAESFYVEYASKPVKPKLIEMKSSSEAELYFENFKKYEAELEKYNKDSKDAEAIMSTIKNIIFEYIQITANFESVPEKYQNKVWEKAWSDGHSDGYYSVYLKLVELVTIFN